MTRKRKQIAGNPREFHRTVHALSDDGSITEIGRRTDLDHHERCLRRPPTEKLTRSPKR